MKVNIMSERQIRKIIKDEFKKLESGFWSQTNELRKRIIELETKSRSGELRLGKDEIEI